MLLPVYNGAATLDRAISSILEQHYHRLELVIVDDASTDDSGQVAAARADDPRVRILTNEENLGLVGALNRGLRACRGELVARIDQDDWSSPTRLERQVAVFDATDVVLCATALDRVAPDGELLRSSAPPPTHAELAASMLTGNRIFHSSVVFRRHTALSVGGYRAEWGLVEDYDLWLRLLEAGRYCGVTTVEGEYMHSPEGMSMQRAREQAAAAAARAAEYRADLTGRASDPTVTGWRLAREMGLAAASLRGRLRRRGIETDGIDATARRLANAAMSKDPRLLRFVELVLVAPRLAIAERWRPPRDRSATTPVRSAT